MFAVDEQPGQQLRHQVPAHAGLVGVRGRPAVGRHRVGHQVAAHTGQLPRSDVHRPGRGLHGTAVRGLGRGRAVGHAAGRPGRVSGAGPGRHGRARSARYVHAQRPAAGRHGPGRSVRRGQAQHAQQTRVPVLLPLQTVHDSHEAHVDNQHVRR